MIREAKIEDLEQLKNIYNDAILHTVATFDTEVKDDANRRQWFREHEEDPYVIFVEEHEERICGYASLSRYRDRKAFDRTVEISIYIDSTFRGRGIGKTLMAHTLEYAKNHPKIATVVSLVTGENAVSIHLHDLFGFVYCGQLKCVGFKQDRWLDLNCYQVIYESKLK